MGYSDLSFSTVYVDYVSEKYISCLSSGVHSSSANGVQYKECDTVGGRHDDTDLPVMG